MTYGFMDIARTPSVAAAQAEMGADNLWVDFKGNRAFDRFTSREADFIAERDSFYIASVSETGWPYVQHRGGPPGFLTMIDDRTLAFLDYRGNRQYISTGNVTANNRVCLILVDYRNRARLKIYGRVQKIALGADRELTDRLTDKSYRAVPERILQLTLDAFDWNCPQHITPRFTEREIAASVKPLHDRIGALEQQNADLREKLWVLTSD
jgi:predicted pyridoxine 5'-phosphate oxidase superfamily flavin-nucleotide-binding protein